MSTATLGFQVDVQQVDAATLALERLTIAARNAAAAANMTIGGAGVVTPSSPGGGVPQPAQPARPQPQPQAPPQQPAPPAPAGRAPAAQPSAFNVTLMGQNAMANQNLMQNMGQQGAVNQANAAALTQANTASQNLGKSMQQTAASSGQMRFAMQNLRFQMMDMAQTIPLLLSSPVYGLQQIAVQMGQIAQGFSEMGGIRTGLKEMGRLALVGVQRFWPIAAAVGAISGAIMILTREVRIAGVEFASFTDVAKALFHTMFDWIVDMIIPGFTEAGKTMADFWEEFLKPALIQGMISSLAEAIRIWEFLKALWKSMFVVWDALVVSIKDGLNSLLDPLNENLDTLRDWMQAVTDFLYIFSTAPSPNIREIKPFKLFDVTPDERASAESFTKIWDDFSKASSMSIADATEMLTRFWNLFLENARKARDVLDEFGRSERRMLEGAQLNIMLAGKGVGEIAKQRHLYQEISKIGEDVAGRFFSNTLTNADEKRIAQIRRAADEYGKLIEKFQVLQMQQDAWFTRATIGFNALEKAIAATGRALLGLDFKKFMTTPEAEEIRRNKYLSDFNDLLLEMPTNKWAEALEFQRRLDEAVKATNISQEQATKIWDAYQKNLDLGPIDAIASAFDNAAKSAVTGASTIKDAFKKLMDDLIQIAWETFITEPIKKMFRNALNAFSPAGTVKGKEGEAPSGSGGGTTLGTMTIEGVGQIYINGVPLADFKPFSGGGGGTPGIGSDAVERAVAGAVLPPGGATGNALLDLISRTEGTYASGYNTTLAHGKYAGLGGVGHEPDLVNMTIDQAAAMSDRIASAFEATPGGTHSGPVGRYQFLGNTLRGLKGPMGLTGSEKFDQAMQDRLALTYAKQQFAAGGVPGLKNTWLGLKHMGISDEVIKRAYESGIGGVTASRETADLPGTVPVGLDVSGDYLTEIEGGGRTGRGMSIGDAALGLGGIGSDFAASRANVIDMTARLPRARPNIGQPTIPAIQPAAMQEALMKKLFPIGGQGNDRAITMRFDRMSKDFQEDMTKNLATITEPIPKIGTAFSTDLAGSFQSFLGGVGGMIGGVGGTVVSGVGSLLSLFMPAPAGHASGGSIGAGKIGLVGESGPELITGPAGVFPIGGMHGGQPQVIIEQSSGARVAETKRSGPNGRDIRIMMRDTMRQEIAQGGFDEPFGARYGARVKKQARW